MERKHLNVGESAQARIGIPLTEHQTGVNRKEKWNETGKQKILTEVAVICLVQNKKKLAYGLRKNKNKPMRQTVLGYQTKPKMTMQKHRSCFVTLVN